MVKIIRSDRYPPDMSGCLYIGKVKVDVTTVGSYSVRRARGRKNLDNEILTSVCTRLEGYLMVVLIYPPGSSVDLTRRRK